MASLTKINLDQFSLNNNKYLTSKFLKPSFTFNNRQTTKNQHQLLINQITIKTHALAQHNGLKKLNAHHPNYLTFCQQYADILCQKYNPFSNPTPISQLHLKPPRNQSPFHFSLEQTITKSLILYKRYFQTIQFDFEKDHEELLLKLKYLGSMLRTRNQTFSEKDQKVDEELEVMEMFMNGLNKRICRQFVTPFALFVGQLIDKNNQKRKTPQKIIRKKHTKNSTSYKNPDYIKLDSPPKQKKNPKTRSFIVRPNSPDLLKSLNNQNPSHQNSKSPEAEQNRNMFVSFNFQHQNQQKNPRQINGSFGGDTLKYSESEFNNLFGEGQMRISLERSLEGKEIDMDGVDESGIPFSPVQPYRLHKLYNEENLKKFSNQEGTHKTAKQQIHTAISHQDPNQFTPLIDQFHSSLNQFINPQLHLTKKLTISLAQSTTQLSQLLQKSNTLITQQKFLLNQQWNDIVDYLGKDIEELQSILILEKAENDMKDKKFLQNLEVIQSELIEVLFEEKQLRKTEESVLTQVLTNLVESLENDLAC